MSPQDAAAHRDELARGRELYREGGLRQSWEIDSAQHGAVCLFEAGSAEQAQAMADSFPRVAQGAVQTQLIALRPNPAYFQVF